MMPAMLVDVPMMKPAMPIKKIITFLKINSALGIPDVFFKCMHVSIIAGKARPNADKHNAPNTVIE